MSWHRGGDLLLSRGDGFYPATYYVPYLPNTAPHEIVSKSKIGIRDVTSNPYFEDDEEEDLNEMIEMVNLADSTMGVSQLGGIKFDNDLISNMMAKFLAKLEERGFDVDEGTAKALFVERIESRTKSVLPSAPWKSNASFSRSLSSLGFSPHQQDPAGDVSQILLSTGNGRFWAVLDRSMLRWAYDMFERRIEEMKATRGHSRYIRKTESSEKNFQWDNLSIEISGVDGSTPMAVASHLAASPHPIMVRFSYTTSTVKKSEKNGIRKGKSQKQEIDLEVSVCVDDTTKFYGRDSNKWNFDTDTEGNNDSNDEDDNGAKIQRHILYREGRGWGDMDTQQQDWIKQNGGLNVWLR